VACIDLLLSRVSAWREDDTTVEALIADLSRLVNELGFSTHSGRAMVALPVAELRDTIDAVGGMTMNERLFSFDLFERWGPSVWGRASCAVPQGPGSAVRLAPSWDAADPRANT
jgi:hypothetical protein